MKKTNIIAAFMGLTLAGVQAQAAGVPDGANQLTAAAVPAPTAYHVVKSDANQSVMQRETYKMGADGKVVTQVQQYTKLGTGMNYWDGQQWSPSVPTFEAKDGSFVADKVVTKEHLAANLNTHGAVTTVTPDGVTLSSTPSAIALYNAADGKSLVIGTIANCEGVMANHNEINFQNAFSGVHADIHYTLKRGTFEQDVVFTGQLNPEDYGFPAASTRIQVLTEFYQTAKPEKVRHPLYVEKNESVRNRMTTPDFMDENLAFGGLTFGHGEAYPTLGSKSHGVPVGKEYKTINGRTFLIESVRYSSIQKALQALPKLDVPANLTKRQAVEAKAAYAAIPEPGMAAVAGAASTQTTRQIAALDKNSGVVVDYVVIFGSTSPTTFSAGTYFVADPDYYEAAVTIDGGAIFKYPDPAIDTCGPFMIQIDSTLTCNTACTNPAIFTASDDNTVGDTIYGSTGVIDTNGYAQPALLINNFSLEDYDNQSVSNLVFRFCQTGITLNNLSEIGYYISYSKFLCCVQGMDVIYQGCGWVGVSHCNLTDVQQPFYTNGGGGQEAGWDSSTIANAGCFFTIAGAGEMEYLSVGNCVFANVTSLTSGTFGYFTQGGNSYFNSPSF